MSEPTVPGTVAPMTETARPRAAYLEARAVFGGDRTYRYVLCRRWEEGRRTLVVIGLNPSTADESQDDPTIRRCIAFAKRERCVALTMLNLYALRSTSPDTLWSHPDPVGPENDAMIQKWAWPDEAVVVAAWGAHAVGSERPAVVRGLVPAMNCFGRTKGGQPRHPLYVRSDTPLVRYP